MVFVVSKMTLVRDIHIYVKDVSFDSFYLKAGRSETIIVEIVFYRLDNQPFMRLMTNIKTHRGSEMCSIGSVW